MNVRDIVVRGSEKVIGHYQLLPATARDNEERELLQIRIVRERQFISETLSGGRLRDAQHQRVGRSAENDPRRRMIACICFAPDGSTRQPSSRRGRVTGSPSFVPCLVSATRV